jgi:hypothetical protein
VYEFEKSVDRARAVYAFGVDEVFSPTRFPGLKIPIEEVFSDD